MTGGDTGPGRPSATPQCPSVFQRGFCCMWGVSHPSLMHLAHSHGPGGSASNPGHFWCLGQAGAGTWLAVDRVDSLRGRGESPFVSRPASPASSACLAPDKGWRVEAEGSSEPGSNSALPWLTGRVTWGFPGLSDLGFLNFELENPAPPCREGWQCSGNQPSSQAHSRGSSLAGPPGLWS